MKLPDQEVGATLYNGQIKELIANLSRYGDAKFELARDHFLLVFKLQGEYIKATYFWKKNRLRSVFSVAQNVRIIAKRQNARHNVNVAGTA